MISGSTLLQGIRDQKIELLKSGIVMSSSEVEIYMTEGAWDVYCEELRRNPYLQWDAHRVLKFDELGVARAGMFEGCDMFVSKKTSGVHAVVIPKDQERFLIISLKG